jgi:phosphoglycolate phosphatase-like HAD superfamily hydrolase
MSTEKPVVVFDLDGVLCDFALGFSRLCSTMFLFKPFTTIEQVTWKDYRARGLSYDDIGRVWEKVAASDVWWETLPPLNDALDSGRIWMDLLASHVELHYVTNRKAPANVGSQSRRWLEKYGFPAGEVHVVSEKAEYVRDNFGDRLRGAIDDSPYNIRGYAKLGLPLYVREWRFNQGIHPELPRVGSVKEFCTKMLPHKEKTDD